MARAEALEWMKDQGEVTLGGDKRGWKCTWEVWDEWIVDFGPTIWVAVQRVLEKAKGVMEEEDLQIHKREAYERLLDEIG